MVCGHMRLLIQLFVIGHMFPCIFSQCEDMRKLNMSLSAPTELKCGHFCPREHGWKMLPVIWAPLQVQINCSSSSYSVLTANSLEQLPSPEASTIKWCGLDNLLKDPHTCRFQLSPLQDNFLAVEPATRHQGDSKFTCIVNSTRELSLWHMVLTAVGVLLYFNAAHMAMNDYFRLTSGSLMFMSGAVLILGFILMRSMPYKRSLAALITVSSTSLLAMVRWLYGTWLPDAHTLITSRPFLCYLGISALLGWGVTYWFDDTSNVKLNTTIRVVLQMAGLSMVYNSVSDEYVAISAVALLLSSKVLWTIGRGLLRSCWWTVRISVSLLQWLCSKLLQRQAPPLGPEPSDESVDADKAAVDDGLTLGLPDSNQQEPLLSDDEDARPAASPSRISRWHTRLAGSQTPGQERGQSDVSPWHLKQPPPTSPFVQSAQWRQQVAEAAAADGVDGGGGYAFPSSTPAHAAAKAQKSPWSQEKTVFSVNESPRFKERKVFEVGAQQRTPGNAAAVVQEPRDNTPKQEGSISPLVASGKIVNLATGRLIHMHKSTYNELLSQGYTADLQQGVLVPPGRQGTSPAAAAAAAAAAGSSRQTPSGNLRQRRAAATTPQ